MTRPAPRTTGPTRTARRPVRRDRGASTIELAMYMPLLLAAIFLVVQFSLAYLGDRAAQAVAREAARVARAGGGTDLARQQAEARGQAYAAIVGRGVLFGPRVRVELVGPDQVRATVTGSALEVVPGVPMGDIRQVVQGPVETFRADTP